MSNFLLENHTLCTVSLLAAQGRTQRRQGAFYHPTTYAGRQSCPEVSIHNHFMKAVSYYNISPILQKVNEFPKKIQKIPCPSPI
jgi:hypothetical protein